MRVAVYVYNWDKKVLNWTQNGKTTALAMGGRWYKIDGMDGFRDSGYTLIKLLGHRCISSVSTDFGAIVANLVGHDIVRCFRGKKVQLKRPLKNSRY